MRVGKSGIIPQSRRWLLYEWPQSRWHTSTWRVKTQSTDDAEPHAMQYVSDAEGSNPHSVPDSDAETTTSNLHSIPGDSVVGSDSDMEERSREKTR